MKKIISVFVLLTISIIGLQSCSSNGPKSTAEKFLTSFSHLEFEAAKSVSTEETKKILDMYAQFTTIMADSVKAEAKKINIKIVDEKIEGEKAVVTYTTSEDDHKTQRTLDLVKKEDKWLVSWNKGDMEGGEDVEMIEPELEEEAAQSNEPIDTVVAPPADVITE